MKHDAPAIREHSLEHERAAGFFFEDKHVVKQIVSDHFS